MKLCLILTVCVLATLTPTTHAFLGAKLALLGLAGNLGGSGGGIGGSSGGGGGGGYGSGNYRGGFYGQQNRPVYSGGYGNGYGYGYGRQAYGGGYNYGTGLSGGSYGGSYGNEGYSGSGGGGEQIVRVIKVIVPSQNEGVSSNYASAYSNGYSSGGWTPIPAPVALPAPAPAPVAVSHVRTIYQSSPVPAPAPAPAPQVSVNLQPPVVQASTPYVTTQAGAPVRTLVQAAPSPVQGIYYSTLASQPIPQTISQSIASDSPPSVQHAQVVKTVKLIVDEDEGNQGGFNGVPALSYGPPPQPPNVGAWGSSNISSGGWNNGYKSGGIWEKIGCGK